MSKKATKETSSKVEETQKEATHIVSNPFRDKESKEGVVIATGTDVSHFDKERLEDLVKRGLVVKK